MHIHRSGAVRLRVSFGTRVDPRPSNRFVCWLVGLLLLGGLLVVQPAHARPGDRQQLCAKCEPGGTIGNDSIFVSQSVPANLSTGQSASVSITLTNTGTKAWSTSKGYALGAQNPANNATWGSSRIALPVSVASGQSITLSFPPTPPAAPGTYNFQWKMLQEGVAWFGEASPSVAIAVAATNTAPTVAITSPATGTTVQAASSILVSATAADAGGSVASVSFWSNGALLGSDTSAPYAWPVALPGAGSYQLKAVATDNSGLTTTSAPVAITVTPATQVSVSVSRFYVYDEHQQLCKTVNPESGATMVSYDAAGNVAWTAEGSTLTGPVCDRAGVADSQKVRRTYDKLNRVIAIATPGGTADLTQSYHPDGSVKSLSVQNPGGFNVTTTYGYNKRRLLSSESSSNGSTLFGLSYGYDANASLSSLTYPDNHVVSFAPDGLGRAQRVSGSGGAIYADEIAYAVNGAIRQFKYGNGIVHTMEANARMLPARSQDSFTGSAGSLRVIDDEYAFDANGNVTGITDRAQDGLTSRSMAYDGKDRLTLALSPGQWGNATYAYDAIDNLRIADQGERRFRYNYDATNRLANIKSPAGDTLITLAYDSHGNTTRKTGQAYVFDAVNRMNQVTGVQAYRYDGQGRRVQTTDADGKTTFWIYGQNGQVLYTSEARRSQNLAYIYLGNTQVATRSVAWDSGTATVRYQHTDALGSPVAETDANRGIVKRNSYTPYGEAFGATSIDGTGYTGHVMDRDTGLTYMQQRYYDSATGRFFSVDPIGTNTLTAWNFSRYNYAANNPYKFTDPDGRSIWTKLLKLIKNGGDVAQVTAGVVSDFKTIADPAATTGEKAVAAASMISEAFPLSIGDAKAGINAIKERGRRVGDFTRAEKKAAKSESAAKNGGQMACEDCGKPVENIASKKGVPTPDNQAQVHHDPAIKDGGGRDSKAVVLCPPCHNGRHKSE